MLSALNNEPIMTRSTLAAGIAQNMFAGEAGESEGGKEKTEGYFYHCSG